MADSTELASSSTFGGGCKTKNCRFHTVNKEGLRGLSFGRRQQLLPVFHQPPSANNCGVDDCCPDHRKIGRKSAGFGNGSHCSCREDILGRLGQSVQGNLCWRIPSVGIHSIGIIFIRILCARMIPARILGENRPHKNPVCSNHVQKKTLKKNPPCKNKY